MRKRSFIDMFKGRRIKNQNVESILDNRQLLHYEFTDVNKTLATVHGEAFTQYRETWNAATKLELIPEMPLYILLETNSYCNMKCKMCTRNFITIDKKIDISDEIVDRIVQQCIKYKVPSVFVGAGAECLINPNIKEILKKLKSIQNLDCILITNGRNIDEDMANFLIDLQFERVYVSLDAAREETYRKIRGSNLAEVEFNLNQLLELREMRKSVLPLVRVSFVRQKENWEEQEEFFNKWKDKVDIIDYQNLIDYKDLEKIEELEEFRQIDFQCVNPFRMIVIDYEGNIVPCSSDYAYSMPIGNIMEMSLEEAWKSKQMQNLRESVLNKSYGKICRNCIAHCELQ